MRESNRKKNNLQYHQSNKTIDKKQKKHNKKNSGAGHKALILDNDPPNFQHSPVPVDPKVLPPPII